MIEPAQFDEPYLREVLRQSRFRKDPNKVVRALRILAKSLESGYQMGMGEDELVRTYARTATDDAEIRKLFRARPFNIFFTPSLTQNGELVLTMFLGAKNEEIERRKRTLRNINKHLYHGFLDADSKFLVTGASKRDLNRVTEETENTAYAKFYIMPNNTGKSQALAILMHPFQRARLVYDPALEQQYTQFGRRARTLRKAVDKLAHSPTAQKYQPTLQQLVSTIRQIEGSITHPGGGVAEWMAVLNALILGIHKEPILRIRASTSEQEARQDPRKSGGKPTLRTDEFLRIALLRFRGDAVHIRNMYRKKGREYAYSSAGQVSGKRRELVLLLASGLVRHAFEESFRVPAHRYMLAPDQIGKIRLMKEKGGIREKIKHLPGHLMARNRRLTETITIPLNPVGSDEIARDATPHQIEVVSMDRRRIILTKRFFEKRKAKRLARREARKKNR